MPSTLSDFANTSRLLKTRVLADLTLSGSYTDYTNNLDNYTIYTDSGGKLCGIYNTVFDAELNFTNPSTDWAKSGRPVRAYISVTSDNGATYHEEQLFIGTTSGQGSVPVNTVKIKATPFNSNFLDKTTFRQTFINQDINDIITELLLQVGVSIGSISLTPTGTIVPFYFISNLVPIREYIEDLARASLQFVGFDRNNIFRASSLQKLTYTNSGITADVTCDLSHIKEYYTQDISSNYYSNKIKVKGSKYEYIFNGQLYFNNQLTDLFVRPQTKFFYAIELPDNISVEYFGGFVGGDRPQIGQSVIKLGYQLNSFYDFWDNDEGFGSANNLDIRLLDQFIYLNEGKEKILLVFENISASQGYYLKSLIVNGTGLQKVAELGLETNSDYNLAQDGQEYLLELESNAIQDNAVLNNLSNLLQINTWNYADVYSFDMRGRPNLEVGKTLSFKDKANTTILGIATDVDTEVSKDRGYVSKVTVKKLRTDLSFGGYDDVNIGYDDINYQYL